MKNIKLIVSMAACILLAGCISRNTHYTPSLPQSVANAPYVSDTNTLAKVEAYIEKAKEVNQMSAPVNPYSGAIQTGLEATSAGLLFVSGLYLRMRNALAAHKKALQTVTNVIAANGGNAVALANAPDGQTAAIIATHLQDAVLPSAPLPKAGT